MDPLFSQSDQDNTTVDPIDPNKDYAAEFIGEGKKYKDIPSAARALAEKDSFIERLKTENAQMRSSLKGEEKIDALLDKLKTVQPQSPVDVINQETTSGQSNTNQQPTKALSIEEVEALLNRRRSEEDKQRNLAFAVDQVKKKYGANYALEMNKRATEMGVSQEFLTNVASTQPQAFLKLVEATEIKEVRDQPQGTVNTSGLPRNDNTQGLKTQKYYTELRKQIGDSAYFKPKIQNELHTAAQKLGAAFFDS